MTATKTDELVEDYLNRLETALRPLPTSRRDQLISEITEHIEQGRAGAQGQSEAAVRELLERLGDPEEIAAAALIDEPPESHIRRISGRLLVTVILVVLVLAGVTTAGLLGAFTPGGPPVNHHGRATTGTTIPITAKKATVPNVIGLSVAQAMSSLSSAGLSSGEVDLKPSNSIPPGTIISQSPVAGSLVSRGSNIEIAESTGPGLGATTTTPVPAGSTLTTCTSAVMGYYIPPLSWSHGGTISSDQSVGYGCQNQEVLQQAMTNIVNAHVTPSSSGVASGAYSLNDAGQIIVPNGEVLVLFQDVCNVEPTSTLCING